MLWHRNCSHDVRILAKRYTMDWVGESRCKNAAGERLPAGGKNWYCKFADFFSDANRVGSFTLRVDQWKVQGQQSASSVAAFNRKISMSCRESRQSGWRHSAWENFLREWMKYQFLLHALGRAGGRWQFRSARRASMDTWPPPDGSQPFMPFCSDPHSLAAAATLFSRSVTYGFRCVKNPSDREMRRAKKRLLKCLEGTVTL